jgi:hypothetical protein
MVLTFQDKKKYYTPQWVIDSAPITEFEDINVKSKLFDKEIIYDQPTSPHIIRPISWSPSGTSQKYLDNDENWKQVNEETLLQTNDQTDYMTRRSVDQQKDDYKLDCCTKECFPVKSVWEFSELKDRVEELGKKFNFLVNSTGGDKFVCSKSRSSAGKNSQRQDCQFKIRFSFLFTVPGIKKSDNEKKSRRKNYDHRNNPKALCMITEVCSKHNHPRTRQKYVNAVQKSGKITKCLPETCIFQFLNIMRLGKTQLSTPFIRDSLEIHRERAPDLVFDALFISNLRKKLGRMLRELSPSDLDDLDTFSQSFKSKKLERLLIDNDDDNGSNDGNSQSTENCKQIVQEYRRLSFQDSTNDVKVE